jgi:class 3 adenylate cyclase
MERKLAALLSADVKAYSRLMGDDEAATVRTLTKYRAVIASTVARHGGRVVDAPGDNVLAEFSSVVHAVQCAVVTQRELRSRNAALPDSRRMQFRIGINLGDVIVEDQRLYGDGVNIAARVERLAEGGGICLSGTAYDQVEGKLPLGSDFLGEQTVKNIARPVRVYRLRLEPSPPTRAIVRRAARPPTAAVHRPRRDRPPGAPWRRRVGRLALARDAGVRAGPTRQAVGGRAALHQPESGPGAGVLQRRSDRRPDHRALEDLGPLCHRAQFGLHLQGPGGEGGGGGKGSRRPLRAGRRRPASGQSGANHRATRGRDDRLPHLGRALRSGGWRYLRPPGRGDAKDRPGLGREAHRGRATTDGSGADRGPGGLRPCSARAR